MTSREDDMDDRGERRLAIGVIGDGDAEVGSTAYGLAESVGERLIDAGFRVVTGGLGGVMEAACRGARRAKTYRPGDTVGVLPGHDSADANAHVDVAVPTGLGHGRNLVVAHSDAVVAVGGGAGTLSELAMAWILHRLIVAFRIEGWSGKLAGSRIDERVRFADLPEDQVFGVDTAEQAVMVIRARLPLYRAAR
jgi:uncharacterized protein (TIGR00725 family)